MNDNIIEFPGYTVVEIPVETVLDGAKDQDIDHLVIMGRKKDGAYYFASSTSDAKDMMWICEKFKQALLDYDVF